LRLSKTWIGRIFEKSKDPIQDWLRDSKAGERLEGLVSSGALEVLWDEVLAPMDQEAYEAFLKQDPSDFNAVAQTQKMSQVIADIRKRVERKIELGRFARQKLKEFTEE
jgi:hypothetical protein